MVPPTLQQRGSDQAAKVKTVKQALTWHGRSQVDEPGHVALYDYSFDRDRSLYPRRSDETSTRLEFLELIILPRPSSSALIRHIFIRSRSIGQGPVSTQDPSMHMMVDEDRTLHG